ncbi:MAG: hypothetical protein ACTSV3_08250 [Candidatus Thorarchaeota archaeon]|nr:MAG: hypothetical protein DRO87_11550 [Candidatus Thorarchaeota archaeon]RLI56318.1 MAG: hypothetical protein DRP09_06805 [Candidatus Thorarchaeota archaeon]
MTKRILIAGMNPFDSGKTQLAASIAENLLETGDRVEYFKPVSGHNYWLRYDHTKKCMESGLLASKDASTVRSIMNPKSELALSNPVHSLFVPAALERPLKNITNTLGLAGWSSVLVLERFSKPVGSGIDTTVLVADELMDSEKVIISHEEVGRLTRGASIVSVRSFEDVQRFEYEHFEEHVSKSFKIVESLADTVIIEGFNDSPWPWDGLETVDSVLVVGPGHVFVYNPEKFRKATYLMSRGGLPIREVTFYRINDLLRPEAIIRRAPGTDLTAEELRIMLDFHRKE